LNSHTIKKEITIKDIEDLYSDAELIRESDISSSLEIAFRAKELSETIGYDKGYYTYFIFSGFEHYFYNRFDLAAEEYNKGIEFFKHDTDEKTLALFYQLLAYAKMRSAKHTDAIFLLEESLKIRRKYKDEFNIARIYNNLAVIWSDLDDFSKSFEFFKNSLELFRKINNRAFVLKVTDNLANTYRKIGKHNEALNLRMNIYNNLEDLDSEQARLFAIVNLASDYSQLDDLKNSLLFFEKAVEMCINLSDENTLAKCYQNIGVIEVKENNYQVAMNYFEKARDIFKSHDDKYNYIVVMDSIADLNYKLGNNNESIEIYKKTNKLSHSIGFKTYEANSHLMLSKIYQSENNFKLALDNYIKYSELERIIFDENVATKISDLQSVYELDTLRNESDFEKKKNIELSGINKQLEEKNAALNDLLIEKSEILSIASHDLRSPLSNIIGLTKILREEIKDKISSENKEDIDNILNSANQMLNIIENILTEETFNKGSLIFNFDEFDLRSIISEVISSHTLSAENKKINIKYTSTPKFININSDPFILKQIIDNLLSNAIKFSPAGKNVFIMANKKDSTVKITVKDEGPGISHDDMKNLFKKYSKLSAKPTGGETSTGLGLSIVKKYVEALGGNIRCDSEPGFGAEFIIQFNSY